MNKYPEVFQGEVGQLERKLKLEVDDTVQAVRLPVSRILLVKAELKKELDRLEKMDIVQREDKLTDWISSLVVVHKPNGKLRICIDPNPLNRALKRSHYLLPCNIGSPLARNESSQSLNLSDLDVRNEILGH